MTPILKFDLNDKFDKAIMENYEILDGSMDSVLISKVAKLKNEGQQVGPGQYNVDKSSKVVAQSPKGGVKWSHSKSERKNHFILNTTSLEVGPGKYHAKIKTLDRNIPNPTIPRANNTQEQQRVIHFKKKGKIKRTELDELSSDDEKKSPGPGQYLHDFQITQFGKNAILHDYP